MVMLNESLLDKNKSYIVGVSGGVDSMALLDMLVKQHYPITVLHMNYHLREDSDEDEKTVREYCKKYHLPFFVEQGCQEKYHGNFEMQARKMRYEFYRRIGQQIGVNKVVLAHHYDDYIETVIMQLQRHNTIGFLGIKEVSKVNHMNIIRPLLKVKKEKLYEYCQVNHVNYREDYTNYDITYTRNRIRHIDVKSYSKEDVYQRSLAHNKRYLKRQEQLKNIFERYNQQDFLTLNDIKQNDLADVIYYMLKKYIYPPYISKSLIEEIIKQLSSKKPNIQISLPVNFVFIKEYDNICIRKKETGDNYCKVYDCFVYDHSSYYLLTDHGHLHDGVCLKKDDFPITIRNFRTGDKIKTAGGTKKVSRLFIDRKISKEERELWPILLNRQNEIILIPHIAKNIEYLYTKPNIFVVKLDASKRGIRNA